MTNEQIRAKIDLVTDKLLHLGGADYSKDKTTGDEDIRAGIIQRDFGIEEWDWPQGIGLYGLSRLQNCYGDGRYNGFFQNWYRRNLELGLPSKNINTTAPLLALLQILDDMPDKLELEALARERADWLIHGLPRTEEGGFQHVTSAKGDRNGVSLNENQVWADTLVMAVLFLNEAGQRWDNAVWREEALHQLLLHIKYLYDKRSGLIHHAWSFARRDNFGGVFWCRGNSWFTYGVMAYLEACGESLPAGVRTYLLDTFRAQARALRALQSPGGLWHTVLTDPTSYEETSGSAAIAAGLLKGLKAGVLDESYRETARRAIEGICRNIGPDGTVRSVSAGTGVGMDAAHYKRIVTMPMAYGQSLTLLALCEALGE